MMMEDGLEMIDRKNSGLSINKQTGNGPDDAAFMGLSLSSSKPKTSSTSSSDSASTSDSFNESAAPPGYNFSDESITESSFHDVSGPHRELPVDVPDSFVGTIKQTPRYPTLHQPMPTISTFKPQMAIRHDSELTPHLMGSNNPFALQDDGPLIGSDHCINTTHKSMQPQPQTPTTKDKVYIMLLFVYHRYQLLVLLLSLSALAPIHYTYTPFYPNY